MLTNRTQIIDALLYFRTETIKAQATADIDELCNSFVRPCPTQGLVDELISQALLEINNENLIRLTDAGSAMLRAEGNPNIEIEVVSAGDRGSKEQQALKPNPALPLFMYIRFLEVIQLDLDALLHHINDSAFFQHNRTMAHGFVLNLSMSYADQDCLEFLQILTDLLNEFRRLAEKDSDKVALLTNMKTRIRDLLEVLTHRQEADHD